MSAVKEIAFHQFIITALIIMQAALCHDWQGSRGAFQGADRDYYIRLHLTGIFLSRKQAKSYTASSGVPMVLLMLAAHHALPAHISQGEPGQHQLARLFTDALRRMIFFVTLSFLKGNMMNSNQKGDQRSEERRVGKECPV